MTKSALNVMVKQNIFSRDLLKAREPNIKRN